MGAFLHFERYYYYSKITRCAEIELLLLILLLIIVIIKTAQSVYMILLYSDPHIYQSVELGCVSVSLSLSLSYSIFLSVSLTACVYVYASFIIYYLRDKYRHLH